MLRVPRPETAKICVLKL